MLYDKLSYGPVGEGDYYRQVVRGEKDASRGNRHGGGGNVDLKCRV